jgi:hypothetical protein
MIVFALFVVLILKVLNISFGVTLLDVLGVLWEKKIFKKAYGSDFLWVIEEMYNK